MPLALKTYPDHRYIGYDRDSDPISAYNRKPISGKLNFGIELEIGIDEESHASVEVWNRVGPNAVCKRDGSVDDGIEIVSAPLLFGAAKKFLADLLSKSFEDAGFETHHSTEYGMHVHVSADVISKKAIERVADFMCNPKHKKFMTLIAGRCTNGGSYNTLTGGWFTRAGTVKAFEEPRYKRLAAQARAEIIRYNTYYQANGYSSRVQDVDEYVAKYVRDAKVDYEHQVSTLSHKSTGGLRLNTYHGTHEFRLFCTTFDVQVAQRNIEFCEAVIRFARTRRALTVESFTQFVSVHNTRYALLAQLIAPTVASRAVAA